MSCGCFRCQGIDVLVHRPDLDPLGGSNDPRNQHAHKKYFFGLTGFHSAMSHHGDLLFRHKKDV